MAYGAIGCVKHAGFLASEVGLIGSICTCDHPLSGASEAFKQSHKLFCYTASRTDFGRFRFLLSLMIWVLVRMRFFSKMQLG